MEPNNTEIKRNEDGTFADGTAPGPGRPKGKTLKEFARQFYMLKSDEEKIEYIRNLEEKKPGFAWQMAEGNPAQGVELSGEVTNNTKLDDEQLAKLVQRAGANTNSENSVS